MKIKELLLGFIIGIITAFVGGFFYLLTFTEFNLFTDFNTIIGLGIFSSVLKLGAVLNIAVFFILLKFDKDAIARGIILSLFILTIFAFFL